MRWKIDERKGDAGEFPPVPPGSAATMWVPVEHPLPVAEMLPSTLPKEGSEERAENSDAVGLLRLFTRRSCQAWLVNGQGGARIVMPGLTTLVSAWADGLMARFHHGLSRE